MMFYGVVVKHEVKVSSILKSTEDKTSQIYYLPLLYSKLQHGA